MSLISQERLLEKLDHCQADQFFNIASIRNFIREEPEAVVRCKDCEYWDTDWQPHGTGHFCAMIDLVTNSLFYCAEGERKEDG